MGRTKDGVTAFRGVPYAAAPVGPLRWRPPQPVPAWAGARDAAQYGSDCLQHPLPAIVLQGARSANGLPRFDAYLSRDDVAALRAYLLARRAELH